MGRARDSTEDFYPEREISYRFCVACKAGRGGSIPLSRQDLSFA